MTRDCKHGQLARACERCADEREIAELRALVQHQASELFELRKLRDRLIDLSRWKSTHAPRLAALEGLLHTAQAEAHAGREAVATLASEREANARLTDEVERLRTALDNALLILHAPVARSPWMAWRLEESTAHLGSWRPVAACSLPVVVPAQAPDDRPHD